jgi:hypothetical protein
MMSDEARQLHKRLFNGLASLQTMSESDRSLFKMVFIQEMSTALREAKAQGLDEAARECLALKYHEEHNDIEGLHDWVAERAAAIRKGEG